MSARQVAAYEYDCDACGKPLLDPEWETPLFLRGTEGGAAPDLGDYDLDTVQRIEVGDPIRYVHNTSDTDCWHWCQDDSEYGLGPAEACPDKDTHEAGS